MATSTSFLEERLDAGALPIAVGDVLAIFLLVTAGVIQHNGVPYLSNEPVGWVLTAVPFLISWAIISPLLGAYSPGAAESAKSAVPLGIRSWLVAAVVGVGIRWTPLFEGGAEPAFVAVMLVLGSAAIAVWRTLYFRIV
ncbi:DUF3054 domain-containing protein [Haloferax mediterranei ATCC 33500]|uniref:DUF3054 domain-containing protein n=1 Tax=Haloferax mediterranei (strain ATCC 33500 / DSM 1411 / JCM 8866 / NBRC 14739 / NCIMB 2177 / R-4) TaxID=523841 RepID=I3R8I0_HALMT|nr:DUF3054 domain-containing protein [Haloferax mediterranei]AFK20540.1 hypothetical protein HFX_2870 [Haloferax mediterranei ATCC 33500]AHZ23897.1 hypothetical protein BM92_15145 [Haloferax mediterranei ATCC 33500]ELZ98322.1 hypothetical protein C439_16095 [Haloferax mediterranei ATCC 33500]MDX5986705.1 DUF3054 domain-containing protein [Haloferax mediterranei ATCC 33500]QCQ76032.1 DUF3054 domain-containing protein [Haloferax mediterranei ATCC 33500]